MKMHYLLTFFTAWILLSSTLIAQKMLSLENPRRFVRYMYNEGDNFKFKIKGEKGWNEAMIEEIHDSALVLVKAFYLNDEIGKQRRVIRDIVPINDIGIVRHYPDTPYDRFRRTSGGTAVIGGISLLAIAGINSLILDDPIDPSSARIAGGIAGAGVLLLLIGKKNYRLGNKWALRVKAPLGPDIPAIK